MKFKLQHFIALTVIGMAVWFIVEATSQPGVHDLKGNPEELVFVRNENNTGPVKRVYAVAIEDTLWQEMQKYGSYMPHNKYGNTQVYFFLKSQPTPPELNLENPIETQFQQYCLARYEKDAMGNEHFAKYPFSVD